MIPIYINNIRIKVKPNTTVLQACDQLKIEIPKFCFHEHLQIAGNCRMCLVEVLNSPKPVASCAMPVMENMQVFTNTPLVKKARESVLEFLLLNHPLDCPICDQGGECDLQDQSFLFGTDKSRFFFLKRSVQDKNVGPFIKTIMTRCIHCTRCVRFANDICGVDNFGTTGRGTYTEIGFYLNKIFFSEFSGNIIDICPVGALTSKPYAFKARPWELNKIDTIDVLDSIGSNIEVHVLRNEVIKIVPQTNSKINLEWISNKVRFFFDSTKYQRIKYPLLKQKDNTFKKISWFEAFYIFKLKIFKEKFNIKTIVGDFVDLKTFYYLKKLNNVLGFYNINYEKNLNNNYQNFDINSTFLFNTDLNKIKDSNLCLLVGCNPRVEGSILNIHLKNSYQKNTTDIAVIGQKINLTYPSQNIGLSLKTLIDIIEGKHFFCRKIKKAKNPFVIFGNQFILNKKNYNLINNLQNINKLKNINILNTESSFINFLEVNSMKKKQISSNLILLINTNIDNLKKKINKSINSFIVYQGHHFTENAQQSDLILPSLTFLEKRGIYINIEGFVQKTKKVFNLKTMQKSDINILKSFYKFLLFNNMQNKISFDNLFNYINKTKIKKVNLKSNKLDKNFKINFFYFKPIYVNFYGVNILEKYSKTLMNSSKYFKQFNHFE